MRLALELGLRDYVDEERLSATIVVERVRRDRLGADRGDRRARRSAPERVHCVSMPSRYSARTGREATRGGSPRRLGHRLPASCRSSRSSRLSRDACAEPFRGPRAGSDRGEPPGAHPRRAADGALEQVRLARRRDREQVGALGRLRDALRRHGRRLRAPQGRVQDGRVPAGAAPERARGSRADPGRRSSTARRAPSCAPTSSTRTRCRPTRSSTECSRRTSSSTARARS